MQTHGLKLHLHTEQGICQGSEGKRTTGGRYWGSVSLQEQTQDPPPIVPQGNRHTGLECQEGRLAEHPS